MSSDPKTDVRTSHRRSKDSLLIKFGKALLKAEGHGVYILPLVLMIMAPVIIYGIIHVYGG